MHPPLVWGGVRFAHPKFTFLSSRIVQKRKQWLAQVLELSDETRLAAALGPHWWFHFSKSLSEVVLPVDFYKVGTPDNRVFDQLGLRIWRIEPRVLQVTWSRSVLRQSN